MIPPDWLWIPVTVCAAFAQTMRNAAQRSLTAELGTLGATLVRFLYGLPFALLWLCGVQAVGGYALPTPNLHFLGWVSFGAVSQIIATALLLRVMQQRNFTLGIAYSKTEIIQVALFGFVVLGDPVTVTTTLAVACGTLGVLLLTPADRERPLRTLLTGWTSLPAMLGLASGACFAFSAVGYRGAALALGDTPFMMSAAFALVVAQSLQTVLLGGWLLARDSSVVMRVFAAYRRSLFAGFMGAVASAGWLTAMAIEPIAHVRTLGLIELLIAPAVSRKLFREKLSRTEITGMALLTLGLVIVTLAR